MITHGYKREEGVKDSSKFLALINGGRFILLTEKRGGTKEEEHVFVSGSILDILYSKYPRQPRVVVHKVIEYTS